MDINKLYEGAPINYGLTKSLDKVLPIDPSTGLRRSAVTAYQIALTDAERFKLQSLLVYQQVSKPSQLSDEQLIATCPSRYMNSEVDISHYLNYVKSLDDNVDDNSDSSDSNE